MPSWTLEHVFCKFLFVIIMFEITDCSHCIRCTTEKFSCTFKLFLQEGGCYVYLPVCILFLVVYLTNIIFWNILDWSEMSQTACLQVVQSPSRMSDFVTITTCLLAVSALVVTVEWFWPMAGLPCEYCSPRTARPVLNSSRLFYHSVVAHHL